MSEQSANGNTLAPARSAGVVRIAWIELDVKTGVTTLRVSTGIQDPLAFAKTLADLAVQYAVERALDAARVELATLAPAGAPRRRGRA